MVNSESEVLPSPAGALADDNGDAVLTSDFETLLQSRSSRPHLDEGWEDLDHYFESDAPSDQYIHGEWKEKYKDNHINPNLTITIRTSYIHQDKSSQFFFFSGPWYRWTTSPS